MQQVAFLIDHAAQHRDVLAEFAIDQPTIDVVQHLGRLERAQRSAPPGFVEQARGHELQQDRDECRGGAMAGHIRQIEANAVLVDAKVVDEIA